MLSTAAYWEIEQKLAPGLRYSQSAYEEVLNKLISSDTHWVDVGCGRSILPQWRPKRELLLVGKAASVIGVDIDQDVVAKHRSIRDTRIGSIYELPLESNSADVVTANMVVEHLEYPVRAFTEVRRVLRSGGKFLIHTPNLKGYIAGLARTLPPAVRSRLAVLLEGRHEEDVYRTYYRCNTEQTIRHTAEASGLDIDIVKYVPTNAVMKSILPLAAIELTWIRMTMNHFESLRTNIIGVLSKSA